ncbi:sugar ABC transporter substrate-binding protein [Glycomyces harbinensis]|uniref:Arabinogalactan oligomer / maltooligosaccharide transport system substrate-binding protein n=1 Tax=Glycomyces harbinensis TaxID=58114 RepID=A0A1G6XG77_9ACTN|nr:extracellular solute-binding protein [Glycomyces harbinensis]SDD77061.1 arabinogalactan oligomer / maltooligosaccharide transport system substrate-binding protein [Glycomyces harbinensis]
MDWSNIPNWISSVSSMAALLFAAVAAVAARNVYKIESARDQANAELRAERESMERRDQAALVSAWWGYSSDAGRPALDWGVFIRNASETPVYDAKFSVLSLDDPNLGERFEMAVLPPAAEPVFRPIALTAPNSTEFRVEATFTDSSGQRWIRDKQGRLHELGPKVLVWGEELRINALRRFFSEFLATHGVDAQLRSGQFEELFDTLRDPNDAVPVPDILVGPHDWIGILAERRMIEPLRLSPRHRDAFDPLAIDAMTFRGELYGIPYAFDAPALLRNVDLVPAAPASFEEMIHMGQELLRVGAAEVPFAMQVPSPYYLYPVLLAAGGELFGRREDGGLDTGEFRVNTPRSRAALERFRELGLAGLGCLRPEIGRIEAVDLFITGRTPFLLCASRVLREAQKAGLNLAVEPVPPYRGFAPVRPMVTVHGFCLTRRGRNKTIAKDLIVDHLTRTAVSSSLSEIWPHVPVRLDALERSRGAEPAIRAFYETFRSGDPIPSMPEMGDVWRALKRAEVKLVDGAESGPVARQLAKQLEELTNDRPDAAGRQRAKGRLD